MDHNWVCHGCKPHVMDEMLSAWIENARVVGGVFHMVESPLMENQHNCIANVEHNNHQLNTKFL